MFENPDDIPFDPEGETGDDLGSDPSASTYNNEPLTSTQIRQLYQKVEKSGSPDTKHLLAILDEAQRYLKAGDEEHAFEDYSEVSSTLSPSGDATDPNDPYNVNATLNADGTGDDQGNSQNPAPTRVQDRINYFEAASPKEDFQLTDTGDGSKNVITTDGNVVLSPLDPLNDTVKISSDNKYYIFTFTHKDASTGKTTTTLWKVDRTKVNSVHLAVNPNQVTGDIHNSKNQVTVGTDSNELFISNNTRQTLGGQLSAAIGKIGYQTYYWQPFGPTGMGTGYGSDPYFTGQYEGQPQPGDTDPPGATYTVGWQGSQMFNGTPDSVQNSKGEAEEVKNLLTQISQAVSETDPKKRADLWGSINGTLSRWASQDDKGGGIANNKAQLLFNVLYGELGEEGFKSALQNGLLDPGFAQALAGDLTAKADENNNLDTEITGYQSGGPGWTHQSSADFLTQNAGSIVQGDGSGDGV
jgi:hypothetical protein